MQLSDKILRLRKSKGMSQEELAQQINVSRQAVSRWETGSAKPDTDNVLQISRLFGVTADYLLNDDYESDNDLPKVKENRTILHTNLTLIAIIAQASFLNAAMQPFQIAEGHTADSLTLAVKLIPLLACSVWMCFNLRYEKNVAQYKKNIKIELAYCVVQVSIALAGHYSKMSFAGTLLLIAVALIYILWINPRYMNRPLTRSRKK